PHAGKGPQSFLRRLFFHDHRRFASGLRIANVCPMTSRIDWVRGNCRLLLAIAEEFGATQPFRDLTIGTGIHLEPKTVALLLTLKARSEEHTSELQSHLNLVCRLLLEKKKKK